MIALAGAAGLVGVAIVLLDAFETVILPRRVVRRWRIGVIVFQLSWPAFRWLTRILRDERRREQALSYYGPGSLLLLLLCWMSLIVVGYAAAIWAFGGSFIGERGHAFGTALFSAASTFFTLGFGAQSTVRGGSRAVAIANGGTGFAFLALIVSYLPTLYQAFSRREVYISQLDARAGSPPSAGELLARHGRGLDQLEPFLAEWESWSADLLESVLSFPTLGYYRSHHDGQSWVAGLTVVMDACSLLLVGRDDAPQRQARLTYAMARHAAVDLAQVLHAKPQAHVERLDEAAFERLQARLGEVGWDLTEEALPHLAKLRSGYEPYVAALSEVLVLPLPLWTAPEGAQDSWRVTEPEGFRRPSTRSRTRGSPHHPADWTTTQ
jgi:hypothetical protein